MAEPAAAEFLGDVGGEVTGLDALVADLVAEFDRHLAAAFDLRLVRIDFVFDEGSDRIDDHLLFKAESKMQHL